MSRISLCPRAKDDDARPVRKRGEHLSLGDALIKELYILRSVIGNNFLRRGMHNAGALRHLNRRRS
jgi:hypothetical protein